MFLSRQNHRNLIKLQISSWQEIIWYNREEKISLVACLRIGNSHFIDERACLKRELWVYEKYDHIIAMEHIFHVSNIWKSKESFYSWINETNAMKIN